MDNDHDPAPQQVLSGTRLHLRHDDPLPGAAPAAWMESAAVPFEERSVSPERHRRDLESACFNEQYLLAPAGYFVVGFDSAILQVNLAGAAMLGVSRSHPAGQHFRSFVTHPFLQDFDALLTLAFNSSKPLACRVRMRRAGHGDAFQATLHASADGSGQACRIVVEPADGSLDALAFSEERFRRIAHNAEEGIWEIDAGANTTFVNPRMAAMLGYSIEAMHAQPLGAFLDEDGRALMEKTIARRQQGAGLRQDFKFICKDGSAAWTTVATHPIFDPAGAYIGALALVNAIPGRREATALNWQQTNYDTLTGLPNRDMFLDRLSVDTKKADRGASFLALLLIDLDRFKEINERLGHVKGDLVLVEASRRIAGCVRASDTLARIGGDVYAVILAGLDHAGSVERIAQQMIAVLAQPFDVAGEKAFISASIGIALYPPDAGDINQLLECADQAMYVSKNAGGQRFSYFKPDLQEAALARQNMAGDLREALRLGQFEIVYQPIVSLRSGTVHKAEALLRWRHPQRGLLGPAEFIPFAESNGLIVDIGDWVFREVAQQAQRWQHSISPLFQVSVNKSPVQFRHDAAQYRSWLDYLNELGLPPQSIVVEFTESVLLDGAEQVLERLSQYRAMGLQVALDDFGTGYSSLSHLKRFPIDYVKIDQSFVARLEDDAGDLALCEAIIAMGHKLGLKVVAEGVETKVQRALLIDAGCDFAQGYIFARPMPAAEFEVMAKAGIPRFPH